jgi:hypothetical protein
MDNSDRQEKSTKAILIALTAVVMISGNGTNVDETDNPAAKIKEFFDLNRVIQISKPEKMKTFLEQWLILSEKLGTKENKILDISDIDFDNNKNIKYKGLKSNLINFKNQKINSNMRYDGEQFLVKNKKSKEEAHEKTDKSKRKTTNV